jgi:hypothetical protein
VTRVILPGMPRPKTEREAFKEDLAELAVQKETYQRELDATPVDAQARHEWLMWQIRRVEKRMADLQARLIRRCASDLKHLRQAAQKGGGPRYRTADGESHVRCHEGPRVLVVEDDSALLELIVDVVQRVGYLTNHATNGQEALRHHGRPGVLPRATTAFPGRRLARGLHDRASEP